jgi:hypothetical protein
MAYQTQQARNSNLAAGKTATAGGKLPRKSLYKTGLFAPNKEGVKSIGSVQVKEDVVIPAGSYINLYENDKRTSEKSPMFSLSITEGKLVAKK